MAIQIQGNGGVVADVGGTTFRAANFQAKPIEHGALGQYQVSVATGALAAALAASAQLFQFKWTDAAKLAVILRIETKFVTLTRFTAGTVTDFGLDAFMVRSYASGGGGTALTLTGNNAKLRTSMGTSLAAINVATTGALTAATTLDAQPFEQSMGGNGAQIVPSVTIQYGDDPRPLVYWPRTADGEHPLVLAQNEGFVIRNRTVWPAAGTGTYSFKVTWAEVTAY